MGRRRRLAHRREQHGRDGQAREGGRPKGALPRLGGLRQRRSVHSQGGRPRNSRDDSLSAAEGPRNRQGRVRRVSRRRFLLVLVALLVGLDRPAPRRGARLCAFEGCMAGLRERAPRRHARRRASDRRARTLPSRVVPPRLLRTRVQNPSGLPRTRRARKPREVPPRHIGLVRSLPRHVHQSRDGKTLVLRP